MSVGTTLYNMRKSRGITQQELSNALDKKIAQSTLAQYETGERTPSIENLYLIADYYRVPVTRFFVEEESSDEDTAYAMIDMMHRSTEHRVLFDLAGKFTSEDLRPVVDIMQTIAGRRNRDE